MDWSFILFLLVGLLNLLGGTYEWTWMWRLTRGGYTPDRIGIKATRIVTILFGILPLSIALAIVFHSMFSGNFLLYFIIGSIFFTMLSAILFYFHENQSIVDYILQYLRQKMEV